MKFDKLFIILLVINYCLTTTRSFKLDSSKNKLNKHSTTNLSKLLKQKPNQNNPNVPLNKHPLHTLARKLPTSLMYNLSPNESKSSIIFATKQNNQNVGLNVINNYEIIFFSYQYYLTSEMVDFLQLKTI